MTAKPFFSLLFVLFLSSALFLYRLADRDLWSSHEARAAQNAQSMLDTHSWGLPRLFDDKLELQKPPLYYWIVAALSWLRDGPVDAWSVRLPAALAALVCVVSLLLFGNQRGPAGLFAALMLATMVHFTWLARTGRIDMALTGASTTALLAFYRGFRAERASWPWYLLSFVAVAIGVMLKGPIGLVLPACVVSVFLTTELTISRKRVPATAFDCQSLGVRTFVWNLLWGIPLILILCLPWFWWGNVRTDGALFRSFFLYHNVERAFGGAGGLRAHPWWFYGPRMFLDLLPWSIVLPVAVVYLVRHNRWKNDPDARFGFTWLASIVLLLSCVRFKRADYLLPAYPGAALLLGRAFERWLSERWIPRPLLPASMITVVFGCLAGWFYYVECVVPLGEPARELRSFAAAIRERAPSPELVIFFCVESHALAFHVGRPINTILEWENINTWAGRTGSRYIVMPPDCAAQWRKYVTAGRLEHVFSIEEFTGRNHEQPLVLLRTLPLEQPDRRTARIPPRAPRPQALFRLCFLPFGVE